MVLFVAFVLWVLFVSNVDMNGLMGGCFDDENGVQHDFEILFFCTMP